MMMDFLLRFRPWPPLRRLQPCGWRGFNADIRGLHGILGGVSGAGMVGLIRLIFYYIISRLPGDEAQEEE